MKNLHIENYPLVCVYIHVYLRIFNMTEIYLLEQQSCTQYNEQGAGEINHAQWFIFHRKKKFISSPESRLALLPTQPPVKWVPGAVSLGRK
jgi:hypothetical protein